MTQKELLYYEDAVMHEENLIKICEDALNNLSDTTLKDFMKAEINLHRKLKEELMEKLNEECHE